MRNGLVRLITPVLLASAMVAAGCSNTSNGGGMGGSNGGVGGSGGTGTGGASGGSGVTTLSGTKTVNTLTAAEATQLCNDIYSYFDTAITRTNGCKWQAVAHAASSSAPTQAMLQQSCTNQQNSCLSSDAGVFTNPGCGDIPTNCTATVAQYSTCIADEVTAFTQTVTGLPMCTALTSASTNAVFDAQSASPPASCMSLSNACPALYPPTPLTVN